MMVLVPAKLSELRFRLLCLDVDPRMILKEGPGDLGQVAVRMGRHFVVLVLELVENNITSPRW